MDGLSAGKRCAVGTYPQRIHLNNVIIDSAFCVIQKLVVSLTGENRMKKLILTIVLCAFAMVVAGLNIRSMQNRGVKEATVAAEVADILGVKEKIRGGTSWDVIYRYSYNGKTYEEEVDGTKSCKQGDKANIVIDSGHPNKVILFTKKEKIGFLSVINGTVAIFVILIIIDNRKKSLG